MEQLIYIYEHYIYFKANEIVDILVFHRSIVVLFF